MLVPPVEIVVHRVTADLKAMRAQVKTLAAENDITIDWSPVRRGAAGTADDRTRRIVIRYIVSVESYAVGMHELGHILCGYHPPREGERGFSCAKRLESEALAWDWALQHMPANIAHGQAVTNYVMRAMARYLYWAHCNTKVLPADDAMFWKLFRLDWAGVYWPEP